MPETTSLIIRDAGLADLPAIVDIYNTTIPSRMVTADLLPVTVASRQAWFAEHTPAKRPLWVAEEDDRIRGWISYSSFTNRPAYHPTCEMSVYIAPDDRGRGLGSILLQRAIDHAPSLKVTNLVGLIFGHNAPSLALFERHGFARWGFLPGVALLDDLERDLVIVGRRV